MLICKLKVMKNRYVNYIKKGLTLFLGITVVSSCVNKDDFFLLPDRGGIDVAIWDTPGAIEMHLRRAYDVIMPVFGYEQLGTTQLHSRSGIHYASDESLLAVEDEYAQAALGLGGEPLSNNSIWYVGDKYSFNNVGENRYNDISRCNNAIKYIPQGTLSNSDKKKYLGQYYALRAMVYFGLVKVYGGVPLVEEPQDPSNITVSGRASARDCINFIVRDLDSAVVNLDGIVWPATDKGRITKAAAAALKAKVLMYWASPQFNPLNDPKHPYDQSRWDIALEANRDAYNICKAAGHALYSNYADIFRVKNGNPEVIIVRSYSNTLAKRGHNIEARSRPKSEGGSATNRYRPSTRLLNAYPMKDGNAIDNNVKYAYDAELFWLNRDPRFEATIAYNGSNWPLSGKTNRRQWAYNEAKGEESAGNGVFCKRFSSPTVSSASVSYNSDSGGGNDFDWIEMRFAEVIMNYAECANETGNLTTAKDMIREIRKRAGIEEGNSGNDYGLASATNKEQMRELIYNERFIEFAFENKRNSDLRRMRRMHLLNGQLASIQIEVKDAAAKTALETVVNTATGEMFRESLNLNNKATYEQYFMPAIEYVPFNRAFNIPEYQYFYTFHDEFVRTGDNILPTIGWAGGVFDPLD